MGINVDNPHLPRTLIRGHLNYTITKNFISLASTECTGDIHEVQAT